MPRVVVTRKMKRGKRLLTWFGKDGREIRAYYRPAHQTWFAVDHGSGEPITASQGSFRSGFTGAQADVMQAAKGIR